MFKIMGLVTGALVMAACMLAMTGVPQVAGVDWQAVSAESMAPVGGEPTSQSDIDALSAADDADIERSVELVVARSLPPGSWPEDVEARDEVAEFVETADAVLATVEAADPESPAVLAARRAIEQTAAARARLGDTQAAALIVSDTDSPGEPLVGVERTDQMMLEPKDESTGDQVGDVSQAVVGGAMVDDDGFAVDAGQSILLDAPSGWQPVWAPFRSELSARGFMGRLERLTDLQYRISMIGPGLYQVAFAHAGIEERVTGIAAIEDATGLDLARKYP